MHGQQKTNAEKSHVSSGFTKGPFQKKSMFVLVEKRSTS